MKMKFGGGDAESVLINAGDALADGAQEIGGDGTDAAGDQVRGMDKFSVGAVDGRGVADFHAGNFGDVNHGDVHGDNSNHGRENAANEDAAAIA